MFAFLKKKISLSNLEKAIILISNTHNGSLIGSSVDHISWCAVHEEVNSKEICLNRIEEHCGGGEEFEITIQSIKYDVHFSLAPDGFDLALFRVRRSEKWLDEVFCCLIDDLQCATNLYSKYYLPNQSSLIVGCAHGEYIPEQKVHIPTSFCKLTNLKTLGFISRGVVSLPNSIGNLTNLEELKLGGNSLKKLPTELCKLSNLKILTLWSNGLEELPTEIGNVHKLEGLDLSYNELLYLPESIVYLKSLKRLYMTGNEKLTLSKSQMTWIADLLKMGTSVFMDEFRQNQIEVEHPELATLNRDWFIPEGSGV